MIRCFRRAGALVAVVSLPAIPALRAQSASAPRDALPQDVSLLLDALPFRLVGPASPAGRVWQVIGVPSQPKTFYVCTADGGVWKSTNYGTTLVPIFNDQSTSSCGAVAVAPSDPQWVVVGTGETASTRANSLGRGVFVSADGGATWRFAGLAETEEISAVVIDPRSPRTFYVAALGHLWGANPERGIFKTTDAGASWDTVLFINDSTGFSDLAMDPHNPDVLYAAAWGRIRWGDGDMTESGPHGGIFKTTDGGHTWVKLANGPPRDSTAKITLAVARNNSQIVYAAILTGEPMGRGRTSSAGGVFRSADGGASWTRVDTTMTIYYYDRIAVDPNDDNRVWLPVFELMRSDDGGRTWVKHNMRHVHDDLHSIWVDPNDSDHLIVGGDGGVNTSFDGGKTWVQDVLPIGQFYQVDADDQDPYWVYGGMQDTGHWTGPSRTYDNEGITNYDWIKLRFNGDGMPVHPDPRDPNVVFMVQEFGNTSRLDLHRWERTELQPAPALADSLRLHKFRWDWTPPMLLSHADPDAFFLGANYLFRCRVTPPAADPRGELRRRCLVVSPDLTAQQDRPALAGTKDGSHSYGALFALAQSPLDTRTLWTGADDGPISLTRDDGAHWTRLDTNLPVGSPTQGVVSHIEASRTAAGTAYVAYDNHTRDDRHPYLYKTTDFGRTWTNITADLPAEGSTYVVREDPRNPSVLYVGTEFGLYVSIDGGGHWARWKSNLPMAAVRAMVVQARERELVVGTFGRAIWIGDVAPIEQLAGALARPAVLFDVKPAVAHNIRYTYGATIEELNGDLFFRADNPPYGAAIGYYLRDGWAGGVTVRIADARGRVIRTLGGLDGSPGLHRVIWNLEPDGAKADSTVTLSEQQRQRRVAPGTYTVTLEAGATKLSRTAVVRPEGHGVRLVLPRK